MARPQYKSLLLPAFSSPGQAKDTATANETDARRRRKLTHDDKVLLQYTARFRSILTHHYGGCEAIATGMARPQIDASVCLGVLGTIHIPYLADALRAMKLLDDRYKTDTQVDKAKRFVNLATDRYDFDRHMRGVASAWSEAHRDYILGISDESPELMRYRHRRAWSWSWTWLCCWCCCGGPKEDVFLSPAEKLATLHAEIVIRESGSLMHMDLEKHAQALIENNCMDWKDKRVQCSFDAPTTSSSSSDEGGGAVAVAVAVKSRPVGDRPSGLSS